jgi:SnoaL-like domain
VTDPAFLEQHVDRFNAGVRAGDFSEMLAHFAPDAQLVFEGVPAGPFVGLDAIRTAYAARPPDDQVLLLETPRPEGEAVAAAYAWAADGQRAGRMILTAPEGRVTRLVITFE